MAERAAAEQLRDREANSWVKYPIVMTDGESVALDPRIADDLTATNEPLVQAMIKRYFDQYLESEYRHAHIQLREPSCLRIRVDAFPELRQQLADEMYQELSELLYRWEFQALQKVNLERGLFPGGDRELEFLLWRQAGQYYALDRDEVPAAQWHLPLAELPQSRRYSATSQPSLRYAPYWDHLRVAPASALQAATQFMDRLRVLGKDGQPIQINALSASSKGCLDPEEVLIEAEIEVNSKDSPTAALDLQNTMKAILSEPWCQSLEETWIKPTKALVRMGIEAQVTTTPGLLNRDADIDLPHDLGGAVGLVEPLVGHVELVPYTRERLTESTDFAVRLQPLTESRVSVAQIMATLMQLEEMVDGIAVTDLQLFDPEGSGHDQTWRFVASVAARKYHW